MRKELTGSENGLIGYWSFNEGSRNMVFDKTSNNNDGIIYGGAWVSSSAPILQWLSAIPDSGVCLPGSSNQ